MSSHNDPMLEGDEGAPRSQMFLTFMLGGESYGLAITAVTEIIGFQSITPVPDVAPYVRGIINLRGKVVPVMDVRERFGMDARDYDARTCIIVIQVRESSVGLIVDTVSEVVDIDLSQIEAPPSMGSAAGGGQGFMMGVGKVEDEVKLLLDANRLLFDDNLGGFDLANPAA
ncbi:MAG: chemotaxis protein CheW [Nannocystaceae bacterium]|nr:chemotaxis protein CheW [bacterium]